MRIIDMALRTGVAFLLASSPLSAQTIAEPAASRALELSDALSLQRISRVQVSPDGRRVLFTTSFTASARNREDEVWMLDVSTGVSERLEIGEQYASHRHGQGIAWRRADPGLLFMTMETGRVSFWSWDPVTKKSQRLFDHDAQSTNVTLYDEAPNGQRIAFVVTNHSASADADERRLALASAGLIVGDVNGQRYAPTIPVEVWVWERTTGEKRGVYSGRTVNRLVWSPDGSRLAVQALVDRRVMTYSVLSGGGNSGEGVTVIDVRTGQKQRLRETILQKDVILGWSPDGRSLAIDSQTVTELRSSDSAVLALTGGLRAERWTADAHGTFHLAPEPLIPEAASTPRSRTFANGGWFHWHRNGTLYHDTIVDRRTTAIAAAVPGSVARVVSDPQWHLSLVSFAEHADIAIGVRETVSAPVELASIDLRTGVVKSLTTLNAQVAALRLERPIPYRVTNRFGYTTDNWLIPPVDYQPGKKYPLVILLYAFDNEFAALPWMKSFAPFEYARLGTFVLLANYPAYDGASGEGRETIQEQWRFSLAVNPLASFEAAVDQLEQEGKVDSTKVALCGFSYGGFLTQYAVTHSRRFSAAYVVDGGAWNPGLYYRNGMRDSAYLMVYDFMFGGSPYGSGGAAMREFLPAYGFAGLPVPVLFEGHGGEEALDAYADFYLTGAREGTPIEVVLYKDDHVLSDRERIASSIARGIDWLRYWLLGTDNPAPLDKQQYLRWARLRERLAIVKAGGPP